MIKKILYTKIQINYPSLQEKIEKQPPAKHLI